LNAIDVKLKCLILGRLQSLLLSVFSNKSKQSQNNPQLQTLLSQDIPKILQERVESSQMNTDLVKN
jgi:hypothetical protein